MRTRELWKHLTPEELEYQQRQHLKNPSRAEKRMEKQMLAGGTIWKAQQAREINKARRNHRKYGNG